MGHDATRAGRTTARIGSNPELLWNAPFPNYGYSPPVIDAQGNVFVSDVERLISFDPGGAVRFEVTADSSHFSPSVAVNEDGTIWVGHYNGPGAWVVKLGPDGNELLRVDFAAPPDGSYGWLDDLVLEDDGDLLVVAGGGLLPPTFHAVSPDGTITQTTLLDGYDRGIMIAAVPSGDRYVTVYRTVYRQERHDLLKLSHEGMVLWDVELADAFLVAAAPDETTRLCYEELWALDPSGSPLFSPLQTHGIAAQAPCIGRDGTAFVGSAYGVSAVSPTGAELWFLEAAEPPDWYFHVWGPAALSGEGVLVVVDLLGGVYGIRDGVILWTRSCGGSTQSHPNVAIGGDGTIIVSNDDELCAFRSP